MAPIPEQIGKYKILNHLGSGGTSIVYLGMHPTLKRKVVLKKLNLRGKKTFYDRFLQEAALMMDLNHDHIVKVYDHFKEGSRHYMVMEFVEGLSLDQIIEQSGPLNHETIRYILRCCCKALDYIHSRNIIHRDIKPSNIFISNKGDVKLGDFGVALLDDPSDKDVSAAGSLVGTPAYMAPEQFSPGGRVTPRTDLYALGISYFELLTGRKMYTGESLEELRDMIRRGRHLSLLFLIPEYGFSCWWFIRKAVSRSALFRYPSAIKALRALRTFRMNDEASIQELSERIQYPGAANKGRASAVDNPLLPGFSRVLGVKARPAGLRRRLIFTVSVLAGLTFLIFLFTSGFCYRWFMPDRYGRIVIILNEAGTGGSYPLEDLKIRLRSGDGKRSWNLTGIREDQTEFYRKSGFYSLESNWGNRTETRSFFLPSFTSGEGPLEIILKSPPVLMQWLSLKLILSDIYTGTLLQADTGVTYREEGGDWKVLRPDSGLYAGKIYELAVRIPGYYEEIYTISPEFYRNEYILDAALVPLPGELEIHHNLDRLELEIDHSRRLRNGEKDGKFQRLGKLELESPVRQIAPGVHNLTWSGIGWEQEQKLTVRSGERVIYRITMDADGTPRFSMDRKPSE